MTEQSASLLGTIGGTEKGWSSLCVFWKQRAAEKQSGEGMEQSVGLLEAKSC